MSYFLFEKNNNINSVLEVVSQKSIQKTNDHVFQFRIPGVIPTFHENHTL